MLSIGFLLLSENAGSHGDEPLLNCPPFLFRADCQGRFGDHVEHDHTNNTVEDEVEPSELPLAHEYELQGTHRYRT